MNLASLSTSDWQGRAARARYETRHFIDGKFVDSVKKGRFSVVNPATGTVPCARSARAPRRTSIWPWRRPASRSIRECGAARRRAIAWRCSRPSAGLIKENTERFALLDTLCMGKPITDMVTIDVPAAALNFAYFGELIDKIDGR
jgi:acyl-CoA reductase-like NAD-dependent aldehyde dehydrogenase